MKTLIVVDMQNDFIDGALGTQEAVEILPKVNKKIDEYYHNQEQIILTRDTHWNDYLNTLEGKHLPVPHCQYSTDGWRFAKGLHTYHVCYIHDKESFGTLRLEPGYRLSRQDSIEIVGVCTDICVISNALILKAQCPEVEIVVDASCCAGTTPEAHQAALTVMKSCQINVIGE